jgi:hypothetical protein
MVTLVSEPVLALALASVLEPVSVLALVLGLVLQPII